MTSKFYICPPLTLLETPTTDRKPEFLPPPKRPDTRPTPSPSLQIAATPIPKPEDPNDCKETCKDKYPQYSELRDAVGNHLPFGGFIDKSLNIKDRDGVRYRR